MVVAMPRSRSANGVDELSHRVADHVEHERLKRRVDARLDPDAERAVEERVEPVLIDVEEAHRLGRQQPGVRNEILERHTLEQVQPRQPLGDRQQVLVVHVLEELRDRRVRQRRGQRRRRVRRRRAAGEVADARRHAAVRGVDGALDFVGKRRRHVLDEGSRDHRVLEDLLGLQLAARGGQQGVERAARHAMPQQIQELPGAPPPRDQRGREGP